jgi:alanyl-tRNA synthetase
MEQLKQIASALRQKGENLVVILGSVCHEKPVLCVMVAEKLVKEKSWNASNLVREAAKLIQGGGGGQPTMATAGGKNPDAIEAALDHIHKQLGL